MTTTIIAVPVLTCKGGESRLSNHFARAPFHMVIDAEGRVVDVLDRSVCAPGDGPVPCSQMKALGVTHVICSSMGRGAKAHLDRLGICVLASSAHTVAEALAEFNEGKLPELGEAQLWEHDNDPTRGVVRMRKGDGSGMGQGLGRGLGRGRGRCQDPRVGRGFGRGAGFGAAPQGGSVPPNDGMPEGQATNQAATPAFGMGQGYGRGMGRGMGRGNGCGRGMGRGRGNGRGMGRRG
ncbi:MAG: NifB/NifX family molybdenum-iron cluster-binding protein [Opitutales bacterium]|nr:NifB/NifX family molybdenum-iron cluster-binding protein [Opitutales bacterium]